MNSELYYSKRLQQTDMYALNDNVISCPASIASSVAETALSPPWTAHKVLLSKKLLELPTKLL